MCAKAYALLWATLHTAVDDGLIDRNPCRIRGASDPAPAERPTLQLAQVFQLSELVPPRFRALILVTTSASLRWGEVSALRRKDFDLDKGTVTVREAFVQRASGQIELGPPKSRAGLRTISVPRIVVDALEQHLARFVDLSPDAFIFTSVKGQPIRRTHLNRAIGWKPAVTAIGVPQLHFTICGTLGALWRQERLELRHAT